MLHWVKKRSKGLGFVGLLTLLGLYLLFNDSGLLKTHILSGQQKTLAGEIQELNNEIDTLGRQRDLLKTDDEIIAQAIRKRLEMIHPEDTIFVFDAPLAQAPQKGPGG